MELNTLKLIIHALRAEAKLERETIEVPVGMALNRIADKLEVEMRAKIVCCEHGIPVETPCAFCDEPHKGYQAAKPKTGFYWIIKDAPQLSCPKEEAIRLAREYNGIPVQWTEIPSSP